MHAIGKVSRLSRGGSDGMRCGSVRGNDQAAIAR
jgi:hypothetical protein